MNKDLVSKSLSIFRGYPGGLHTSQAIRLGIASRTLYALHDAELLERVTRGVYRLPDTPLNEHTDLVMAAMRIPKGVICLVSALTFHNLTSQIPREVHVALPLAAEKPRLAYPPVRLFWLSQPAYAAGVEDHVLDGQNVHIYSREKTISDCFKYRNKIGLNVGLEALKEGLAQGCKPETLLEFARIDRVEKIMRPYLEALL
jgi:predicted transcriptional regulator of viral defense system